MKKKDSLEEFIRLHREEFDDLKAPQRVWMKISPKPKQVSIAWKWSAIAASALLLISLGYIIGKNMPTGPSIAGYDEYLEAEQYYESRINQRMDEIRTLEVSDEVLGDIRVLDDVYYELKKQLLEDPNADAQVLITAMIRHQQQKLEVLEEILNRVDKYKTNESEAHQM